MARQLQRRHQPEEAIQILNRLAVLTPARPDIPLIQGRCFRDLDREDEARSSLQEAIRRTPQGSEAWLELGRLELNANHPAEAEKNFTQALRWSPADREVLFNLAQALERLGKKAAKPKPVRMEGGVGDEHEEFTYDGAGPGHSKADWSDGGGAASE